MYICPSHISVFAVSAGPGGTGVYRSKSESSTGQTNLDGPYFKKTACEMGAGNTGEELMRGYLYFSH